MTTCANDHAPIQHDEFYCPLCGLRDDANDLAAALLAVIEAESLTLDEIGMVRLPDVLTKQVNAALQWAP